MIKSKSIIFCLPGKVERKKPHFELRYGSINIGSWDSWLPVVILEKLDDNNVVFEILLDENDSKLKEIIERVIRDIEYYMIDKGEPDPWEYAIYHTGTMANAYSVAHWSYFHPELI